jgi:hypothetical protein
MCVKEFLRVDTTLLRVDTKPPVFDKNTVQSLQSHTVYVV